MNKVEYGGWITADVFPQRHDPIAIMQKTFEWMDAVFALADRVDENKLREMRNQNATLDILDYIRGVILGK